MNNTITIDGRELRFNVEWDINECGEFVKTIFYETFSIKMKRRWIFSNEYREIIVPDVMFTISADFYNERLTKEYWRREIRKKLKKYNSLKNRKEEIKNCEFI